MFYILKKVLTRDNQSHLANYKSKLEKTTPVLKTYAFDYSFNLFVYI